MTLIIDPSTGAWQPAPALTPSAQDWSSYLKDRDADFQSLLSTITTSSPPNGEAQMHNYLNKHPSLLPGLGPDSRFSSHTPLWDAVITEPDLIGSTKQLRPDFLILRRKTRSVFPVLIEIESPSKPYFQKGTTRLTGKFHQAMGQIIDWRVWFSNPLNQLSFKQRYLLPQFQGLQLEPPSFGLIFGTNAEFPNTSLGNQRHDIWRHIGPPNSDTRLYRWDQLTRQNSDESSTLTVRLPKSGTGIELAGVPPTFATGPSSLLPQASLSQAWAPGWEKVIDDCLPPARASIVKSRVRFWNTQRATFQSGTMICNFARTE